MANNFRYIAAYNRLFCHQSHGSDANDGLTPETPKKTLAGVRAIVTTVRNEIIISGHFLNELFGDQTIINVTLIGDGKTIIEYPNNVTEIFTRNISSITNVELRNINKLIRSGEALPYFVDCIVKNVNLNYGYNFFNGILRSTFYNCLLGNSSGSFMIGITQSKFFNCYLKISVINAGYLTQNYFNKACLFELQGVTAGLIGNYNNYECKFKYLTNYYDNLAALVAAYSALNVANRSDVVTFNKPEYGDYTVPTGSPLLNTSLWNSQICGNAIEGVATYWSDGVTNWTISQSGSTDDLEVVSGTLQLVSGKTVGTITRNSDSQLSIGALKTLKRLNFLGSFTFNNGTGVNIPAIFGYTSGDAGYNPIRMTIQLKYSPVSLTAGEWDALSWFTFDISPDIKMDGTYGNGDPSFDLNMPAHLGNIKAFYYLVKIILRTSV